MNENNANMPQPVEQSPQAVPVDVQTPANNWQAAPVVQPVQPANSLPPEYQPLSPWAYFGYQLLFAIPIVGFILLIVFSCKNSNINRRNFARSYWCSLIILAAIAIVVLVLALIFGVGVAGITRAVY